MSDPDEARLPAFVRTFRQQSSRDRVRGWRGRGGLSRLSRAAMEFPPEVRCDILDALHWLATTPSAILLAAGAADAEVLRASQRDATKRWGHGEADAEEEALHRARILSASTHVCLPRAELEALLEKRWMGTAEDLAILLRALLARETGKGEG